MHYSNHSTSQRAAAAPVKKVEIAPAVPKASAVHCAAVYTALLGSLELSDHHQQDLIKRGLSKAAVAANGYKSLHRLSPVVEQLSKKFDLAGVAGFYQENGRWQLKASSGSGFFVPSRDEQGRITGLQIRTDFGTPRYFWLSSKDKEQGAGSGTPAHFEAVESVKASGKILLTEGALKAGVIAHLAGTGVCALAGTAKVPDDLPQRLVELGVENAVIAFDSDFRTNEAVSRFINNLGEALRGAGIKCRVLIWQPEHGKGLDDFLSSNHHLATDAEEISFLDWRKRFVEPSLSTLKAEWQAKALADEPDAAKPITTEKSAFHNYAEIATLLSTMMRLRGFTTCSHRFVETVVKTCGLRSELTSFRDVDLAQMAGYEPEIIGKDETTNTKTIQRWRNKYKAEADQLNLSLIEIVLPEYNFETKSFKSGKYRINPDLIKVLEDALEHLYSISGYEKSVNRRRDAIRKTAERFFRDLPVGRIGERGSRPSRRKSINELQKLQRIGNAVQKLMDEHQLNDAVQSHLQKSLAEIEAAISLQQESSESPHSFKESIWTTESETRINQSPVSAQKQVDTLSTCFAPDVISEPELFDEKQVDTLSTCFAPEQPPEESCSFCSSELTDGAIILENTIETVKSCPSCHRKAFTYTTLLSDPSVDYLIKKTEERIL